jgi:hypothetical protein
MMIRNFNDFIEALLEAGFTPLSGEDVFSLSARYSENIRWHTEDPDTDPWEWRMRVLEERNDIAYGKFFFRKGGLITRRWYPYFVAARRGGMTFSDAYSDGTIGYTEKRIYEVLSTEGRVPLHLIKRLSGFSREDASRFDRALIELQMRMYVTICGRQYKNDAGTGWSSTVLCTVENFFGGEVIEQADEIDRDEAVEELMRRIFKLNPNADRKKAQKLILG